jgi:hypothetical protein
MGWLNATNEIFHALGFSNLTLQSVFLVIFMPISLVYAFGRGLNILKTRIQKNIFAISIIVIFSILEVLNLMPSKVTNILFLCSVGFFMYVVLWQRFYSRADKKLDTVIGHDSNDTNENGFKIRKKKS